MIVLCGKKHAVFRFVINLDLRMIGPHVALAAGFRGAGELDGRRVACVAGSAGPDRAIEIRPTYVVAFKTTFVDRGRPFMLSQCVWAAFDGSRMKFLGGFNLLRAEVGRTGNSGPSRRGVPTTKILIVLGLVAFGTIGGREVLGNDEPAVVQTGLPVDGMMAIETSKSLGSMLAHFKLVDDGGRFLPVALGAFPDGARKRRRWLLALDGRTKSIDDEC